MHSAYAAAPRAGPDHGCAAVDSASQRYHLPKGTSAAGWWGRAPRPATTDGTACGHLGQCPRAGHPRHRGWGPQRGGAAVGKRGCFVAGGCLGWLHPWFHATALDGSSVSPAVPAVWTACDGVPSPCPPGLCLPREPCPSDDHPWWSQRVRLAVVAAPHSTCVWGDG